MSNLELLIGGVGLVVIILYWFVPRPPPSYFMRDGKARDAAIKKEAGDYPPTKAHYIIERWMHAGLTPNADCPPHIIKDWVAWGKRLDASPYCEKGADE